MRVARSRFRVLQSLLVAVVIVISALITLADESDSAYIERRISEALDRETSQNVAERVDAAYTLSLRASGVGQEELPEGFLKTASETLQRWMSHEEEPWVRHLLVDAIGELDPELHRAVLFRFLDDPDPTIRARALEHVPEEITSQEADELVARYRNESFWWVRTEILLALGGASTDDSLEVLHEALFDDLRSIRAAASMALARRADIRSLEPLVQALESSGLVGGESPVRALGAIASPEAVQALESQVQSPYPFVRAAVATALGETGHCFTSALDIDKATLTGACATFVGDTTLPLETLTKRRQLCALLEDDSEERIFIVSTGAMHSRFYSPFNAKAREVWPQSGRRAVGWEDSVGKRIGGTRKPLDKGARVTIWKAAFYQGETWLEVTEGAHAPDIWLRETDLRELEPEELLGESESGGYEIFEPVEGLPQAQDADTGE